MKTITFPEKLVLRNKYHSIYTWQDLPLTSIHSSDFEIPLSFTV